MAMNVEEDIPGAALKEPLESHELKWWRRKGSNKLEKGSVRLQV